MVLSLVELSLRAITNGIKDGTIRHPHLLPPKLRQRVFDMAFKHGLADPDHPNGMEILTSVEFLAGMTSISAKVCNDNDLEFLERLIESLATKLPDGESIGEAVKNMNITVYEYGAPGSYFKNEKTYWDIISKVHDLIGQCPNTASLDLHVRKSFMKEGYTPLNEKRNSACNRVMENLIKLSIVGTDGRILDNELPVINFKQLKTLELDHCYFDKGNWRNLLEKIPLVENLHLFDVSTRVNKNSIKPGLEWILPSKLPHLKSLEVYGFGRFMKCTKVFVNKLMECSQLRQVHLTLDETSTDEESLVQLASMDIDLKMQIRLHVDEFSESVFDQSSRFKVVSIFHEKVESFVLFVWQHWNAKFSTALEDLFNTCSNLTSLGIRQPKFDIGTQPLIEFEEMKRVNEALVRFFSTPDRAQQLEGLRLIGNFDETVLSAVFEKCLNLVRLEIRQCPNLRDQHLIDWVSRGGGKLTDIAVVDCNNVSSEGIIPVLAKSADGLLRYCIGRNQGNSQRNWKTALLNHCPNSLSSLVSP